MRKKKGITHQIWMLVQSGALMCAIVSPIFFKVEAGHNFDTVSVGESARLPRATTRASSILSSQVLQIPEPSVNGVNPDLYFEYGARQLRFESKVASGRHPATAPLWKLSRIEKIERDGSRSRVDLIAARSENTAISSSFVELGDGENLYLVTFRGQRGRELSYTLRIRHLTSRRANS